MAAPGSMPPPEQGDRVAVHVSVAVYRRLLRLRSRLQEQFGVSLPEDGLLDYVLEKAVERLELWEARMRRARTRN